MRKVLFILSNLHDGDIDWLAGAGRKVRLPAGSLLIREGEPVSDLYIILDGRMSVSIDKLDGREINVMYPGEIVGELSFLDSRPPAASVTATAETLLLAIPRDRLSLKLDQDPAFASRFYRALGVFLAHRLRKANALDFLDEDSRPDSLREDEESVDELDPQLLELISLGGKRFEYLVERVGEK